MAFNDYIKETDEYQEIAAQEEAQAQQGAPANPQPGHVGPVGSFEKSDVDFWLQVATVLLLFLIYRELARANGQAVAASIANGVSP